MEVHLRLNSRFLCPPLICLWSSKTALLLLALLAFPALTRAQGITSLSPQNIAEGPGFFLTVTGFFPDGSVILWDGQVRFTTQKISDGRVQGFVPEPVIRESARTGPVVDPRPSLPLPCRTGINTCVSVPITLRTPDGTMSLALPFYIVRTAAPMADVLVRHIEVVQSVQDDFNFVPLVAKKRTVARIYLGLTPDSERVDEPVVVSLRGFRNGVELDQRPTIIRRVTRPLLFNLDSNRNLMNHSAAFEIPIEWTESGDLELLAFADTDIPEQDESNNEQRSTFTFETRTPLKIVHRNLCIELEGADRQCAGRALTANPPGLDFIRKAFPVRDLDGLQYVTGDELINHVTIRLSPLNDKEDAQAIAQQAVAQFLKTKPTLESGLNIPDDRRPDIFIFWMPATTETQDPLSIFRRHGLRFPDLPNVVFLRETSPYTTNLTVQDPDEAPPGGSDHDPSNMIPATLAYVMSGPFDVSAIRCDDAGVGEEIGDESGVGLDVESRLLKPSYAANFVAPCAGFRRWISPSTYESLLESPAIKLSPPKIVNPVVPQGAPIPLALISGTFRQDGTQATITEFVRYEGSQAPDALPNSGSYCAAFKGLAGALAQHCPSVTFQGPSGFPGLDPEPEDLDEQAFSIVAPFPQGATSLLLTYNGTELAARNASANAPTVAITNPQNGDRWNGGTQMLAWNASDADGDNLTYTVLASRDGGETWSILESQLSNTQLALDADQVSGGSNVMFRVLAGDGFHTTAANVGPFEIVENPVVSAVPDTIVIGPVVEGFSFDQEFLLANNGSGVLTVESIESSNTAFRVVSPLAPFEIPAQALTPIRVRYFSPSAGNEAAVLTVNSNATNNPAFPINISARTVGASTPVIRTSTETLNFGSVAIDKNLQVPIALSNVSGGVLNVDFSITGEAFSLVDPPASPITLDGIEQTTLLAQFQPARLGAFNGMLHLASNDPDRPAIDIVLTGSGVMAAVAPTFSAGGVVNAASFLEGISAGSWVSIFGQNFATVTRTWDGLIQGSALPTEVAGVQVLFNGVPGAVFFVSPTQINVQAPDVPPGPVTIKVIVNGVESPEIQAQMLVAAPAFFTIGPGAKRYAAAVHLDGVLVGPPNLFDGAVATRPAKPGERILVFGTGFGPTNPAVPAGQVFGGAAFLDGPAFVSVANRTALVEFAGLSGAGLNQFNIIVPEGLTSFGDVEIIGDISQGRTPRNVFLTIEGEQTSDAIAIVLVSASSPVSPGAFLSYNWTAALKDTAPKSLLVALLLSRDQTLDQQDILLEAAPTETERGQSGVGTSASVRIPPNSAPGEYFFGVAITLVGAEPNEFYSNVLPVTIAP